LRKKIKKDKNKKMLKRVGDTRKGHNEKVQPLPRKERILGASQSQ